VTLKLATLPLSTNHLYGQHGGRRFLTPEVRLNKEAIGWDARNQYRGDPMTGPLKVAVDLFWPDKRKHDADNIKGLLDALSGIVWFDDGQIVDLHIRKFFDKENPHVDLEVLQAVVE
jgi:Holliday junction resolvase RusA-like endonuclease